MIGTHGGEMPSPWVARFAPLVARGGAVLDLCSAPCKAGIRLPRKRGIRATQSRILWGDGSPWPLGARRFAGIVVANYLHRPLMPRLTSALAEGGVLIYETFAAGNERFGRPTNPDFLLRPGELLEIVRGRLRVVAYEEGVVTTPRPAMVQRICAVDEAAAPFRLT